MTGKRTIFLAGDSTVQTYKLSEAPQCGWGAMLHRYFADNEVKVCHSAGSRFENCVSYEMENLIIDNRAMAARSCKNYFDEGRWADLLECVSEGDFVLMQFAHNDANADKPERFLTPEEYKEKLFKDYIVPVREKSGTPVLVTAIAMKDFDENGRCRISFPEYREKMLELAAEEGVGLIDLGKETADYNSAIGEMACRNIYMNLDKGVFESATEGKEDNAHLQFNGAFVYAGFVAEKLKEILARHA
jgi:lysophospholipase L1-like esterase